jgi:hypothetical protein
MAFKSSSWGNQPKGIPGHLWKETMDYGRYGMSLDERRTCHVKIYGWLRAYLPEMEIDTPVKSQRVQKLLDEMPGFIGNLRHLIPHNETKEDIVIMPGDLENIHKNLDALVERWTEIIGITALFAGMSQPSPQVSKADD